MEEKKNKTLIIAIVVFAIVICAVVLWALLGKTSQNGTVTPDNNQYDNLDYSNKDSFFLDNAEAIIKNGKIYYTEGDYYKNVEVATEVDNIVSVALTYNCGGVTSVVYLTDDNKLYSRTLHQVEPTEKGYDKLIASDVNGFALTEYFDPNDTCGGQMVVYKDINGNIHYDE